MSDLFSDVSDISYTSELDDAPVSVKYDLNNGSPLERDKFKVVHFNINSITAESKLETLVDLCKTLNIHVLILTESKLDSTIPDNTILIPGYHEPIRHDRTANGRHGGGCMMYILNTLTYKHNKNRQANKFEHIWVDIKVENKVIAVNTFYRPPHETAEDQLEPPSTPVDKSDPVSMAEVMKKFFAGKMPTPHYGDTPRSSTITQLDNRVQPDNMVGHDSHAPTPLVEASLEPEYLPTSPAPSDNGDPTPDVERAEAVDDSASNVDPDPDSRSEHHVSMSKETLVC